MEVDALTTCRARAWRAWKDSPMPMMTAVRTFDITRVLRAARRRGESLYAMMCYAILRAARDIEVFYLYRIGDRMWRYDSLVFNVVLKDKNGGLCFCDVPYAGTWQEFYSMYKDVSARAYEVCDNILIDDVARIGASVLLSTELDCVVNQFIPPYTYPFLFWGRYRQGWWRTKLPISLSFDHVQMDGEHVAQFFNNIAREFQSLKFLAKG